MKYAIMLLMLSGCIQVAPEHIINEDTKFEQTVDSLICESKRNADSSAAELAKTDSVVIQKVESTIHKIQKLEKQIKQLKAENNELKDKLDDANDTGKPYHIRTISNN